MTDDPVIAGYAKDAHELVPRFEALATEDVLSPVTDLLPTSPARILDVGAGSGRDAAWFAQQGHRVTAVEPVEELLDAATRLHAGCGIEWRIDRLPDLSTLAEIEPFDLIMLIGVWQHLRPDNQRQAIGALAKLLAPSGRLIISVRHGPGAPERPCYRTDVRQLTDEAGALALNLVRQRSAPSIQPRNRAAGVTWTWLCWESPPAQ